MAGTSKEHLSVETLGSTRLAILAGPQERYNEAEFNALRHFVDAGGNLLVLLGEGGEQQSNTNINFLLEEYGIMINNGNAESAYSAIRPALFLSRPLDAVISTVYQKYFHPKECLIEAIYPWTTTDKNESNGQLKIVYPYGATLNVARPAVVMATTSTSCLPQMR